MHKRNIQAIPQTLRPWHKSSKTNVRH